MARGAVHLGLGAVHRDRARGARTVLVKTTTTSGARSFLCQHAPRQVKPTSRGFPPVPNTIGNYNETFFAQEALIQLEKALGMSGRIHRGYGENPQQRGDTIQIRRPANFTAQDAPSTAQDIKTDSVSITLNNWREVKFKLTDKELSLSAPQLINDHIRPAAYALADDLDQKLAALYWKFPYSAVLSNPTVVGDIAKIRRVLFDNKVPLNDPSLLHLMVGGQLEQELLTLFAASGMQPNQQDSSIRDGALGRVFGLNAFANQNTPSHTSGVAADAAGTVDGVNAIGATTILISAITAGATWKKGDPITITGDDQKYVASADGTDADGAAASISIYPGLKKATVGAEVVTIFLGGAAKTQNLAFHRNAIALATAPLDMTGAQLGARMATAVSPDGTITLRSRIFYVGDTSTVYVSLDLLYGFEVLDPNLGARLYAP